MLKLVGKCLVSNVTFPCFQTPPNKIHIEYIGKKVIYSGETCLQTLL